MSSRHDLVTSLRAKPARSFRTGSLIAACAAAVLTLSACDPGDVEGRLGITTPPTPTSSTGAPTTTPPAPTSAPDPSAPPKPTPSEKPTAPPKPTPSEKPTAPPSKPTPSEKPTAPPSTTPAPPEKPTPPPTTKPTPPPSSDKPTPPPGNSQTQQIAAKVAELTNKERTDRGLAPLEIDTCATGVAVGLSNDLADGNKDLKHLDMSAVASQCDARGAGENILYNFKTDAAEIVEQWMNSEGHRANILRPTYTHIGVGIAEGDGGRIYASQDFLIR